MGRYELLGQPVVGSSHTTYRGTFRRGPTCNNDVPKSSAISKLWETEIELMIGDGFAELSNAMRIQSLYGGEGEYFDLIWVGARGQPMPPEGKAQFMGYDISQSSGYSLLSWGLIFDEPASNYYHQREHPPYHSLLLLTQRYFQPRLNSYGLLQSIEDAEFFMDVAQSLTNGFGAVWESAGHNPFEIVELHMIRSREEAREQSTID